MSSQPLFSALTRQRDIYTRGVSGQRPLVPVSPNALAARAEGVLSREAFAYIAGGAGNELTVARNRDAFTQWRIKPNMLCDVSQADTSQSLLGRRLPAPILLSPVGVLEMAHREADLAVARAAASLGLPFIFSNQASVPMEASAAAMGTAPRWFQLYWSKSQALVASLVQRAEACGCEAIVVTLDTTMLGWRPRDLDLAYLPFLRGKGIAQYTSDPVFQAMLQEPETADKTPTRLTADTLRSVWELMNTYVYGLALAGEAGVREVLENLWADFELSMRLSGCAHIREITSQKLV